MVKLQDLNALRSEDYRKNKHLENFLEGLNRHLAAYEVSTYQEVEIHHPFIFVVGAPRSGTTLLTQVLARSFDVGYIDNVAARLWLAPLTGIRLAESILGKDKRPEYHSTYGKTNVPWNIHEFGYFWRHWLQKDQLTAVATAKEVEPHLDWRGLKKTLANLQHHFQKPMVFKNIFGFFHAEKLQRVLGKTFFIYISRDELDTAISIWMARNKFYNDTRTWWSYAPPEINELLDLGATDQIAGQIHFLNRFFGEGVEKLSNVFGNAIQVHYEELCKNTSTALEQIKEKINLAYPGSVQYTELPQDKLVFKTYEGFDDKKLEFANALAQFQKSEP